MSLENVSNESTWVEYDAIIEVMPWGRNDYVIVRVDAALEAAARSASTRRVDGTIDDIPVNLGINRSDVITDAFLYAGKPLLRRLGAAPGDIVRCRLRAADPDVVPIAEDVQRALIAANRREAFQREPAARRRQLLQPVESAVSPQTRQQRIAALVRTLDV